MNHRNQTGDSKMNTAQQQTEKQGAVKIGRNGTKLHPAIIDPVYGLLIRCRCPGTQQGAAYHGAKFFSGLTATCKN
jgi:hypothetical protein